MNLSNEQERLAHAEAFKRTCKEVYYSFLKPTALAILGFSPLIFGLVEAVIKDSPKPAVLGIVTQVIVVCAVVGFIALKNTYKAHLQNVREKLEKQNGIDKAQSKLK